MLFLFLFSFLFLFLLYTPCSLLFTLSLGQSFILTADSSSYAFMLTLFYVSVSVLIWSYYYLGSELVFRRFFGLVLIFLGAMFMLVFSADLLSLFVAWDLLGFVSFFLVVFFRSRSALGGGLLTGLTNRVGDVLFLAFFGLVASSSTSCSCAPFIIILLVAFTKSAQVPFSGWLPAAMLAPTPVSALVHSSTLVTAGVYLLYRFYPSPCRLVVWVGLFTILLSGFAAFVECDFKKIIALSTLSHLGLIVLALGLGERSLSFAHLNTHAAFKALLFIGVGTVIHSSYGSQEARSCSSFFTASPFILMVMLVAMLSMCGFVFLSGWVSKEAILGGCVNSYSGLLLLILFYFGLALSLAYSLRFFQILVDSSHFSPLCFSSVSASWSCKGPVFGLVLCSVMHGSWCWSSLSTVPATLSLFDKAIVLLVQVATLCLFLANCPPMLRFPTPFTYLSLSSSYLSILSSGASTLQGSEVSAWHGAGFGMGSSLVIQVGAGLR